MAIESLFGPSLAEVQELRRRQAEQEIQGAGQQFGVFAPLYQAGLRFGNQAAQGVNTLLGAQDPMLKQATAVQEVLSKYQDQDPSNPVTLEQISRDLFPVAPDAALRALTLSRQLAKTTREQETFRVMTAAEKQAAGLPETGTYQIGTTGQIKRVEAPEKEAAAKTPQTIAEQSYFDSLLAKYPNTLEGRAQAANEFQEWKSSFRQREAAAGVVPASGEVKISDLAGAQKLVVDLTGGSKDKLDTVKTAKTFLDQAMKGEGAALPQLQRQLVKLVGDSQIGQGEVRGALGSAGIVGDTINAVNQFMTGVPTKDKLNSVKQVIEALENINAQSYNQGVNRAKALLGEAKLSEETRKTLIPPLYKTAAEKKASQFVEGKVYQDANGNRARYVNGTWVPVQ